MKFGGLLTCSMKFGGLLSTVDRLPTISEMHEGDLDHREAGRLTHTMEEYLDSIKELSKPSLYPLHGPLKGHRQWMTHTSDGQCLAFTPMSPYHSALAYAPWAPIGLSDVSVTVVTDDESQRRETSKRCNHSALDWLFAKSPFAGLG